MDLPLVQKGVVEIVHKMTETDMTELIFDTVDDGEDFFRLYATIKSLTLRKHDQKLRRNVDIVMQKWVCSKQGHASKIIYSDDPSCSRPSGCIGYEASFRVTCLLGLNDMFSSSTVVCLVFSQDTSTNEAPVKDWIVPKCANVYTNYETRPHHDPNVALFFLEKDLKRGKTVTLYYMKSSNGAPFLPHQVADTKPFSSTRFPEIYGIYSVKPGLVEAGKDTINECEAPGIEGEEKYCATSLESIIDFTKSKLGKYMKAISTEVSKRTLKHKSTIKEEARRVTVTKTVVCHKEKYPYVVFYCHETQDTRFYMVAMEGSDGSSMKAVVPTCHFLPEDHIVWFSN